MAASAARRARRRPSPELLEALRHLAREDHLRLPEDRLDRLERRHEAVRALVEHDRAAEGVELAQPGEPAAGLHRQEALEHEPVGGDARRRQGGHQGRRAGDRHHRDPRVTAQPDQPEARVGHPGRPGIGHERDPRAGLEPPQQLGAPARLVVLEVRDQGARTP